MIGFHAGAVAALLLHRRRRDAQRRSRCTASPGMLGIGMGYHRLLTHRGYKTYKWVEYFLTWCGTLALEGGPIFWVATHRIHHQHSDREGDPHTPREGTWWAHMGWILSGEGLHHDAAVLARYVPDLRAIASTSWLSQVALDLERRRRPRAAGLRRHPVRALGHLLPHDRRPARHLARELRDAQVGIAPLRDARRLDEQLVGGAADVRRGLAQQPSRASDERASRPGLVRSGFQLAGVSARSQSVGLVWNIRRGPLGKPVPHAAVPDAS